MIAALALSAFLGGAVVPVAAFDIPYFLANPDVHAETLRRCHSDYALAHTPECENAEAAGARRLGRPLPPERPTKTLPRPARVPAGGKDRAA